MASVLFLAHLRTRGFKNSWGSAGDTCRGSSLPTAESQFLHVTSIHRRPTPGYDRAAPLRPVQTGLDSEWGCEKISLWSKAQKGLAV